MKNRQFTASIPQGKDSFDALRLAFPTSNGMKLLNAKRFDRQTFLGGAIGYTAYDAIYDSWLGVDKGFESEIPELQYLLVSKTFVFDHLTGEIYIAVTTQVNPDSDAGNLYEKALLEAERLCFKLKEAALYGDSIEPVVPGVSRASVSPASVCLRSAILTGRNLRRRYSRQKSTFLQETSFRQFFPGNAISTLNSLHSNSICSSGQSTRALTCIYSSSETWRLSVQARKPC